jgi:hypothetical protein
MTTTLAQDLAGYEQVLDDAHRQADELHRRGRPVEALGLTHALVVGRGLALVARALVVVEEIRQAPLVVAPPAE